MKELRAGRTTLSVAARQEISAAIARTLGSVIRELVGPVAGRVVSGYWPIKGEPDLRGWLSEMHAEGATTALPVVESKGAPLIFRRWSPQTRMVRGDWNIPVPPPEAEALIPEIVLAPLVGWDTAGYRLGYGGGYFDRTLAALASRPLTIGIGFQSALLATIFPQLHDIPLDVILTEAGAQVIRKAP